MGRHTKWAAEERRILFNLRAAIKYAPQPQRRLMSSMARMLGPDRLRELDGSLDPKKLKPRAGRLTDGTPCDDLKLSKYVLQHLKDEGIRSLGDLCARTATDLYQSCHRHIMRVKIERELHRIGRGLKPEQTIITSDTPCDSIALSFYSRNVLADAGIKTVGELCALSGYNLRMLDRDCSSRFFRAEIKLELNRIGRSLRG